MTSLSRYARDLLILAVSGRLVKDLTEMRRIYAEQLARFRVIGVPGYSNGPLVSVIVPTVKNDLTLFLRLVKSIRNSTYKNYEVINVEYDPNCNKENALIKEGDKLKVVCTSVPGIGYASYLGTLFAKGDLIIRTDADAIFPPHLIDLAVRRLTSSETLSVFHVGHFYYDGELVDNLMAFLYDKYWRRPWNTTGHFIAFKRRVLSRVNFDPKLKYHEDYNFGEKVYNLYGGGAFFFDRFNVVLVSARRIKSLGRLRYILRGYIPRPWSRTSQETYKRTQRRAVPAAFL